jgi:hypothetical protein
MRGNNMADFIDLLTSADYTQNDNLPVQLIAKIKGDITPEELLKWFHSTKDPVSGEFFKEVSLDDCEKIIKNKKNILNYGNAPSVKDGY